jgi:hypothetical protein
MKKPNRIARKGDTAPEGAQAKAKERTPAQSKQAPAKKRRLHCPGLSPATPGERLIYAKCALGVVLGEEIGTFEEDLGPGEKHALKTFRLWRKGGQFRLEECTFKRFHRGRWWPFEKWCQLPKAEKEGSVLRVLQKGSGSW